jgi:hypothetical protein
MYPSSSHALNIGVRCVVLILCLLGHFAARPAQAATLPQVDNLDSLAYLSPDIVEATLVHYDGAHIMDQAEIKVTAVYKGAFTPGQSLSVAGLYLYALPGEKKSMNTRPLPVGDTFFFFLDKAKDVSEGFSHDDNAYAPEFSGVEFIQKNQVIGFAQRDNPGPYVAELPGWSQQSQTYPTPEAYRAQLRSAITTADAWTTRLQPLTTAADTPQLLAMLRERAQRTPCYGRDLLAEDACTRLAQWHDPPSLFDALALNLSYNCQAILACALATPAGREALLQRIGDEKLSLAQRITYARMLVHVGAVYYLTQTITPHHNESFSINSKTDPDSLQNNNDLLFD